MDPITLELSAMAHGGAALGRDDRGRVIFVPGAIPGERVVVELLETKARFGQGRLLDVLSPSPHRVDPPTPFLGPHGGHTYAHIAYDHQLVLKQEVVVDQLRRIGGLKTEVRPVLPSPDTWGYDYDVELSPLAEDAGGFGFWSPADRGVLPAGDCPTLVAPLRALMADIDLDLPGLRRLVLRAGSDDGLLVAMEVDDVEPPELAVDFPVSVAIVLPDRTAANLIGFNHVVRVVGEHPFQVSAGCRFHGNLGALPGLVNTVLGYAAPGSSDTVLDLFTGVGLLAHIFSPVAGRVIGIEVNSDAVADAAANLDDTNNVDLYEGWAEEILPALEADIDTAVIDTPSAGLGPETLAALVARGPRRLVYGGADIATTARDGKQLARAGYRLVEVQPLDLLPQTYHVYTVGLWEK